MRALGVAQVSPLFCAVCTRDIVGKPRMEPIGKDGGKVAVCPSCSGEGYVAAKWFPMQRGEPSGALRVRAEAAARMIHDTGCSGSHAANTHGVSRCYANEVYRELFPHAPRRAPSPRKGRP